MKPVITILWRTSGWKGFSVVKCGHLHALPMTHSLVGFHCWCEKPFFDSHGHDDLWVAAATRQDPASLSLPIEKETC